MEESWQAVLDRFSYGIYLVSLRAGQEDNGMIASWVSQCSHEPPLLLVALRHNRLSHAQLEATGSFCIQVLAAAHLDSLQRFKTVDWRHKFGGLAYHRSPGGLAVLDDAVGWLDCVVHQSVLTGDHTLFIARVIAGGLQHDLPVLTTGHYDGVYRGNR